MSEWDGWDTGRVVLALSAVLYAGIWIQLSLYHWAGAFKHFAMWIPVFATPLFVAGAVIGVVARDGVWGWVAGGLLTVGVIEGLAGLFFHVRGMRYQIGGYSLRNLLSGPPPLLPVAFSMTGVFGLVGLFWNA